MSIQIYINKTSYIIVYAEFQQMSIAKKYTITSTKIVITSEPAK